MSRGITSDVEVRRLVRIAIGSLQLGGLAKGKARHLSTEELALLEAWAAGFSAFASKGRLTLTFLFHIFLL